MALLKYAKSATGSERVILDSKLLQELQAELRNLNRQDSGVRPDRVDYVKEVSELVDAHVIKAAAKENEETFASVSKAMNDVNSSETLSEKISSLRKARDWLDQVDIADVSQETLTTAWSWLNQFSNKVNELYVAAKKDEDLSADDLESLKDVIEFLHTNFEFEVPDNYSDFLMRIVDKRLDPSLKPFSESRYEKARKALTTQCALKRANVHRLKMKEVEMALGTLYCTHGKWGKGLPLLEAVIQREGYKTEDCEAYVLLNIQHGREKTTNKGSDIFVDQIWLRGQKALKQTKIAALENDLQNISRSKPNG